MTKHEISLQLPNKSEISIIRHCFLNPVVSFLAYPEILPENIDRHLESVINESSLRLIKLESKMIGFIHFEENSDLHIRSIFIQPRFRGLSYSKIGLTVFINAYPNRLLIADIQNFQREHQNLFRSIGFIKTDQINKFEFEDKPYAFNRFTYSTS